MKGLLSNRLFRILSGLGLALLAGEFVSPQKTHASCGDYVTFGSDHYMPNQVQTQRPDGAPNPESPGEKPCNTLRCKGETPAPAPPTTTLVQVQDWAYLFKIPFLAETKAIPFCACLENQARVHRVLAIFHPPRPI